MFEGRRCPACDSAAAQCKGEKNGFSLRSCRLCGTLFTAHLPDAASSHDYETYYHAQNLTTPDFVHQRLDELALQFLPYRKNNRLLDVGCGAGTLLQSARRAGWEAEGTEVSLPAVESVRNMGFSVFYGELAAADYAPASFDVVAAVEVLEHVPQPLELMEEVARILRPGGLFWATTPHGCGLSARLIGTQWSVVYPPEHLQLFSVRGIRTMLQRAGFSQIRTATNAMNPYEILHTIRSRRRSKVRGAQPGSFKRVQTGYQLNESLTKSPSRKLVKNALNGILNASRLGDKLKVHGVR